MVALASADQALRGAGGLREGAAGPGNGSGSSSGVRARSGSGRVAIAAAAPVALAAKPKPAPAPASRPAAPSQPATPDPNGRPAPAVVKPAAKPAAKPAPKPEAAGRYVIQVKAFRSEADADAFAQELKDHGHKATVSSVAVPDKGTFFRVRLGPFPSLEVARTAQHSFETKEGHASILVLVP